MTVLWLNCLKSAWKIDKSLKVKQTIGHRTWLWTSISWVPVGVKQINIALGWSTGLQGIIMNVFKLSYISRGTVDGQMWARTGSESWSALSLCVCHQCLPGAVFVISNNSSPISSLLLTGVASIWHFLLYQDQRQLWGHQQPPIERSQVDNF